MEIFHVLERIDCTCCIDEISKIIEELNDQYFVISVEDGYFDKVSDKEMKEYLKAKQRLEGGYYKDEE